ncbi:hypothetical protein GCM10012285_61570 [Streptomyces kronopolitis]|uniref:Uncharacterized protein n=1 Tax=Streptomyces kronopolitis TaxID=1612435 RepID=A0ABQ2K4E0_9ACTN|nr:hypothetical protein [Streptomyces kronopolitis]GGN61959.1 hypothetical protein GCM10012285_61570 [Streptomyces kronopolitis]
MSDAESEAQDAVTRLREEIQLTTSGLSGAMHGIADSYQELGSGSGRGYNVHAHYRANNINTGKPLTELAVELAAWAAEIAAKSSALDARRSLLKQLEAEG